MTSAAAPSIAGGQLAHGPALENVLYTEKDGVAYVTVNRPKVLNALNMPTWADLRTAFQRAQEHAAIRGVILTGAGDRAFIAGADINTLAALAAFVVGAIASIVTDCDSAMGGKMRTRRLPSHV